MCELERRDEEVGCLREEIGILRGRLSSSKDNNEQPNEMMLLLESSTTGREEEVDSKTMTVDASTSVSPEEAALPNVTASMAVGLFQSLLLIFKKH